MPPPPAVPQLDQPVVPRFPAPPGSVEAAREGGEWALTHNAAVSRGLLRAALSSPCAASVPRLHRRVGLVRALSSCHSMGRWAVSPLSAPTTESWPDSDL